MLESKVSIDYEPFNLMELCQMGVIEGFVAEDSID